MSSNPPPTITIYLSLTSSPSSPRIPLSISPPITPTALRQLASNATSIPPTAIKLIFRGRLIDKTEGDAVDEFKLEQDCVIHVLGKPPIDAPSPPTGGASVSIPASSSTPPSSLSSALSTLRLLHHDSHLAALSTASKLLRNILAHPHEEKYRSVNTNNAAFHRRLGMHRAGVELLLAAGFEEGADRLVLEPSKEGWERLVEVAKRVQEELSAVEAGAVRQVQDPTRNTVERMMGDQGMRETAMRMMGDPGMRETMMRMMGDPGMRETAMRMMQQGQQPTVGGDAFADGPEGMRRRMEQFEQLSRQFGGESGSFPVARGGENNGVASGGEGEDSQMTEEEMIAEAIARSLRES